MQLANPFWLRSQLSDRKNSMSISSLISVETGPFTCDIKVFGATTFQIERLQAGRGDWALYRVENGVRGDIVDTDQYRNDLFERIQCGRYSRVQAASMTWRVMQSGRRPDWHVAFTGESRKRRISAERAAALARSGDLVIGWDEEQWLRAQGFLPALR